MICEQPLVADKSDSRGVVTLTLNRPETSNALSRIGTSNGLCKAKRASRVPEGSVLVWCWLVRAPMWTGRRAPRTLCAAQCGCRFRERLSRRPPAERPRPAVNDRSTNHRNLYLLPHVSTPRSRPDPLLLLIGAVLLLGAVLVNELLVWPALATSNELAHRGLQTEAVVVTLWRKIDQRLETNVFLARSEEVAAFKRGLQHLPCRAVASAHHHHRLAAGGRLGGGGRRGRA